MSETEEGLGAQRARTLADIVSKHMAAGVIEIGGKPTMMDAKGRYIPVDLVKPVDKLMDQTVRQFIAYARDISDQIARFKGHCFDDLGSFLALVSEKYGAEIGGDKGNVTLTSYDGCQKVTFQVADLIDFGPELQAAKKLVDACLSAWTAEASDKVRALVSRAFNVDKEGKINRAELFMLTRVEIDDEEWRRAMDAIHESVRIVGSKVYVRFYERPDPKAKWSAITVDLAAA